MISHPQVLLLGNGLNIAYGGLDWSELLVGIHYNLRIRPDYIKELPFPLQAVILTEDHVDKAIVGNCELFRGVKDVELIREPIEKLLSIPFDHILTTNYSYEIERVADGRVGYDGENCSKLMRHTEAVNRADQKYLLHTYNEIKWNGLTHKIWHIHGEARKPQSVILGHYYYGEMLAKYQHELASRGNKQAFRQANNEEPIQKSWLDAFIMGDVYVMGFGYNYSDFDLWWLLNRKKRENASHGKLCFYTHMQNNEAKAELMRTYDADVKSLGYFTRPSDYKGFYNDVIEDIRSQVQSRKVK